MSVNHKARMTRPAASAMAAAHWRSRVPQMAALSFAALSLGLLIAQRWAPDTLQQARLRTAAGLLAAADTLAKPLKAIDDFQIYLREWGGAVDENRQLRLEVQQLRRQQAPLAELRAENDHLRALIPSTTPPPRYFIAARVVGLSGGPQQQSVWINAGSEQGVAVNMAVMAPSGLIGRISEVGPTISRVLLLTDGLSRIPARTGTTRLQAIVSGDHSTAPQLRYLPPHEEPESGEIVTTTGDAHLLPADLPVGVVERDGNDSTLWRIRPLADLGRLDWISVVDFDWTRKK